MIDIETNTKEEIIMNKREIKKQIRATADIIIMCGGVHEAKEKLDQFAATR